MKCAAVRIAPQLTSVRADAERIPLAGVILFKNKLYSTTSAGGTHGDFVDSGTCRANGRGDFGQLKGMIRLQVGNKEPMKCHAKNRAGKPCAAPVVKGHEAVCNAFGKSC